MAIHLSQDELKQILGYDPETGRFWWKVQKSNRVIEGDEAGALNGKNYRYITIDARQFNASLIAWYYVHGVWLDRIDHENQIPYDDRISNLRPVTRAQNRHNAKINRDNESGAKGVRFRRDNRKWQARIQVNGKPISLGHFLTKEEAVKAYTEGAKLYYGEYASDGKGNF